LDLQYRIKCPKRKCFHAPAPSTLCGLDDRLSSEHQGSITICIDTEIQTARCNVDCTVPFVCFVRFCYLCELFACVFVDQWLACMGLYLGLVDQSGSLYVCVKVCLGGNQVGFHRLSIAVAGGDTDA